MDALRFLFYFSNFNFLAPPLASYHAPFARLTPYSSLIAQRRRVPFPRVELFEFPGPAADGAPLLPLRVEPLGDALQVKGVPALPPHHRAVVARELCVRRTRVERHATDAAHVVLVARVPRPHPHGLSIERARAVP